MSLSEIEKLIVHGESETVEFKKTTGQLRRAFETLCAFLNSKGGKVIIGVTDSGKILGQTVSSNNLEEIAMHISKIEPSTNVDIQRVPLSEAKTGGLELLVLQVEAKKQGGPFVYEGKAYQRVSNTTGLMPQQKFRSLITKNASESETWEELPAKGMTLTDIDEAELKKTIAIAIVAGRLSEIQNPSAKEALHRLGLSEGSQPLNAAMVLFGTTFLPYYPQCELKMARFRGTRKKSFVDSRQIRGHAFHLLEEGMTFLSRYLPVRAYIPSDQIERIEKPLIPVKALREILVNALIHRDYVDKGGSVSIAIFDDRIEIMSTGILPAGLTPKDLEGYHGSHPRNHLIAETFYRRGLVEKWGLGTNEVISECMAAGLPAPQFSVIAGSTLVTFIAPVGTTIAEGDSEFSEIELRLIQMLRHESLGLSQLISRFDPPIPERSLRRTLAQLKERGVVHATGKGRAVKYTLLKK